MRPNAKKSLHICGLTCILIALDQQRALTFNTKIYIISSKETTQLCQKLSLKECSF